MTRLVGEWLAELDRGDGAAELELICEPDRAEPQLARFGHATVVLDGVLYNRSDIGRGLSLGADASDAEVVLAGYLRRGQALLPTLRGRFAIVVWDASEGALLALRDPLGVWPLYYAMRDRGLVLSPYMDLLLRQPGVGAEVDPRVAAGEMIVGVPAGPEETTFVAVRRVPPGHVLRIGGSTPEIRRYWEPTAPSGGSSKPSEQFGVLLEQAVRRCHGDGRAGVFLSGGLDSATIAAAAARLGREHGVGPPCAVAIFNPTPQSNEEPMQRAVAAVLGMPLIAGRPDERCPPRKLITAALDLAPLTAWPPGLLTPVSDSVAGQAVASGCEILLTGDGGDEWLLPPWSWAADRVLRLDLPALLSMWGAWPYSFPGVRPRQLARALLWTWGARPLLRGAAARSLARWSPGHLRRVRARRFASTFPAWLAPDLAFRRELTDWCIERSPEVPLSQMHHHEKHGLLSASFTSALMEDSFMTGRRLGAGVLSPFWDAELIGFLLSLPEKALLHGGRAKALARDYLAVDVPFVEGWPGKTFGDPVIDALLTSGAGQAWRDLGGAPALSSLGIVDADHLDRLLGEHTPGSPLADAGALWDTLALESWVRSRIVAP